MIGSSENTKLPTAREREKKKHFPSSNKKQKKNRVRDGGASGDRHRGTKMAGGSSGSSSLENSPVGAYSEHGLHKHYKRAWENLRYDAGKPPMPRLETLDNPHVMRTLEGYREANEITVNDVAALYGRPRR